MIESVLDVVVFAAGVLGCLALMTLATLLLAAVSCAVDDFLDDGGPDHE